MSIVSLQSDAQAAISLDAWELLDRLPDAILVVETGGGPVLWTNAAAEELFGLGRTQVNGRSLDQLLGAGSTLAGLCNSIGPETWSLRERALRLTGKPPLKEGLYDVQMTQDGTAGDAVVISLREQGLGERLEGLTQNRGTVRTLSGLAAALAHEVKNPLSGIRGAAQLLETAVPAEDSELARLIADEVDRICALLDRMEAFSDRHPMPRKPLNIHEVLDHVVRLGRAGAASELTVVERYDPSLPMVEGNRDALVQVFLNLIKNASEACGPGGTITVTTAYDGSIRHGASQGGGQLLPLTVTIADDGSGIPENLRADLFEPFVSGSETRSGLGLSLVAKIVDGHGGIVTVESEPGATAFRVALPLAGNGAAS